MMYIYGIINDSCKKIYVGQTSENNPNRRWSAHKSDLNNGAHHNPYLQASWNKYGPGAFRYVILSKAKTQRELDLQEKAYIEFNKRLGQSFNIKEGGFAGGRWPIETRQRMSLARKGRPISLAQRERISESLRGRKRNPESVRKSAQSKRIIIPPLIGPDGQIYCGVLGLTDFCKAMNLDKTNLSNVIRKRAKSHKGWRLYDV